MWRKLTDCDSKGVRGENGQMGTQMGEKKTLVYAVERFMKRRITFKTLIIIFFIMLFIIYIYMLRVGKYYLNIPNNNRRSRKYYK